MITTKNLLTFILSIGFSLSAIAAPPGGKPGGRIEPGVRGFEKAFEGIGGLSRMEGLRALYEKRPDLRNQLDSISKDLYTDAARSTIESKKEAFNKLLVSVDKAASRTSELMTEAERTGQPYTGKAEEVLKAAAFMVRVVRDLAVGGEKGDVQMAIDVADMFSKISKNDLKTDASVDAIIARIVERLSQNGRTVSWTDFLDKCAKGG